MEFVCVDSSVRQGGQEGQGQVKGPGWGRLHCGGLEGPTGQWRGWAPRE